MDRRFVYVAFKRCDPFRFKLLNRMYGSEQVEHCELVFPAKNQLFVAVQNNVSMVITEASRYVHYDQQYDDGSDMWILVPLDSLTNLQNDVLYDECVKLVGRPYNVGGMVTLVFSCFAFKYPQHALFCSEALAIAFINSKITTRADGAHRFIAMPVKCWPADIFKYCMHIAADRDELSSYANTVDRYIAKSEHTKTILM